MTQHIDERQKKILSLLQKEAIDLDWNIAFQGKAKGNRHLFRVNKIIEYLVKKESADYFITVAGGWIHDTSLIEGEDSNSDNVFAFTSRFLSNEKFGLKKEEIQKITAAVASHETSDGTHLSSQIIHDADTLDKSGMLGVIRHIWKMTNMLENRILDRPQDLVTLQHSLEGRQKKLFTESARTLLQKLERGQKLFFENKEAFEVMKRISTQAHAGVISDKIADEIIHLSPNSEVGKLLRTQLQCLYLEEKLEE
jgi:HD superfamily phosphodiesterase